MAKPCHSSGCPSSSAELELLLLSQHNQGCWRLGVYFSIRAEGGVVRLKD